MRQDGGVELGRALRHQAEIDAVFAAFLGNARHRLAGRTKTDAAIGCGVAMRFLAHEQQRRHAVAPQAEVERHAAQHRHHRIHHLGREAGELHDGHRPAIGGQPEQIADHFRHGVAADIGVVEHEGVARVVAHGFDARDQLVIDDARGAVLELAHPLVDQRDQIDQPVRHRRIGGVAAGLRIDALEADAVGVLVLGVDALRQRDHFGQNVEFFRHTRATREQHVDDLVEIEQPERQLQIARVDHHRALAEAAAIFVVHVEQEDAQVRPRLQDFIEQQRHAGRFADAGRPQHGKMLRQQFFDIDIGDHRRVLLQRADIDLVGAVRRVHGAQLVAGNQLDRVADRGIGGDAAQKLGARAVGDLAEQIDRGAGHELAAGWQILARHFGDGGNDRAATRANADKAPDRCAHLRKRQRGIGKKSDARDRSAHRNDGPERCCRLEIRHF